MPVVSPQMPPLCKASSLHKIRDGVEYRESLVCMCLFILLVCLTEEIEG